MTELHLDTDEWAHVANALHEMIERETETNFKEYLQGIATKIEIALDPIGAAGEL